MQIENGIGLSKLENEGLQVRTRELLYFFGGHTLPASRVHLS